MAVRGRLAVPLDGPHVGVEVKDHPYRDVYAPPAAADRRCQGALQVDSGHLEGLKGGLRQPVPALLLGQVARRHLPPDQPPGAAVGLLNGRVHDLNRAVNDLGAYAVALEVGHYEVIWDYEPPVLIPCELTLRWGLELIYSTGDPRQGLRQGAGCP